MDDDIMKLALQEFKDVVQHIETLNKINEKLKIKADAFDVITSVLDITQQHFVGKSISSKSKLHEIQWIIAVIEDRLNSREKTLEEFATQGTILPQKEST